MHGQGYEPPFTSLDFATDRSEMIIKLVLY